MTCIVSLATIAAPTHGTTQTFIWHFLFPQIPAIFVPDSLNLLSPDMVIALSFSSPRCRIHLLVLPRTYPQKRRKWLQLRDLNVYFFRYRVLKLWQLKPLNQKQALAIEQTLIAAARKNKMQTQEKWLSF